MPTLQVGRYGGLEEEVEHLKRDKNVLMLELVRLRQQQQVCTGSPIQQSIGSVALLFSFFLLDVWNSITSELCSI